MVALWSGCSTVQRFNGISWTVKARGYRQCFWHRLIICRFHTYACLPATTQLLFRCLRSQTYHHAITRYLTSALDSSPKGSSLSLDATLSDRGCPYSRSELGFSSPYFSFSWAQFVRYPSLFAMLQEIDYAVARMAEGRPGDEKSEGQSDVLELECGRVPLGLWIFDSIDYPGGVGTPSEP